MRRLFALLTLLIASTVGHGSNVPLTGTILGPDNQPFNGSITFSLTTVAREVSTNKIILPTTVTYTVTNGTIQSGATLKGVDDMDPSNVAYVADFIARDNFNGLIAEYYVGPTGASFDLGTATFTPITIQNIAYRDLFNIRSMTMASGSSISSVSGTYTINNAIIASPSTTGTDSGSETLQNKTLTGAGSGNSVSLLNSQGQLGAITGNSADQNVYTYTLPANTVGAGKGIRLTYGFIKTNAAATTYKLSLGGTTVTLLAGATQAGQVTGHILIFNNAGVQTAQTWYVEPIFQAATIAGTAGATSAVNLANSAALTLTFNVANTDSVTPQIWLVELVQ